MADSNNSFIDRCSYDVRYVHDDSHHLNPRKRFVPKTEEYEHKKIRESPKNSPESADSMISQMGYSCDAASEIRSIIKDGIESNPGFFKTDFVAADGTPLIIPPPGLPRSDYATNSPSLLKFDQIDGLPALKKISVPPITFTSVPNVFASCEENIQSLLMFLSNDAEIDTNLFSTLVAAFLDKKTPSERRYLCHKIFSCLT